LVGRFCLPETELVPQFLNIYSDKNILWMDRLYLTRVVERN
jgi:hypothetical protein